MPPNFITATHTESLSDSSSFWQSRYLPICPVYWSSIGFLYSSTRFFGERSNDDSTRVDTSSCKVTQRSLNIVILLCKLTDGQRFKGFPRVNVCTHIRGRCDTPQAGFMWTARLARYDYRILVDLRNSLQATVCLVTIHVSICTSQML